MSVKINALEAENVKRIKTVALKLNEDGVTVIDGRNSQGKTSLLNAIAWALGGEKFRPSNPDNDNAMPEDAKTSVNAHVKVTLSNGLVAERKGKNGTLTVTDPEGNKGGQAILNDVIELLALDLPKFMDEKNKGKYLLNIIGVGDELQKLDEREKALYEDRHAHGKQTEAAKKYADKLPYYEDAPKESVSSKELIQQQQDILLKNAENQKLRDKVPEIENAIQQSENAQDVLNDRIAEKQIEIERIKVEIAGLQDSLAEAEQDQKSQEENLEIARKTAEQLTDESTEALEKQLQEIEETNEKVRANKTKAEAVKEAEKLQKQYKEFTDKINEVRKERKGLLEKADIPLDGLTVEQGELQYNGQAWDCMSNSEQLKVATAIVRKLNPECGFVLLDKLEQMDNQTLTEFGEWAQQEGLQIIGTRVNSDGGNALIIEDGTLVNDPERCPIEGKMFGKKWTELPAEALQYAQEHAEEMCLTQEHLAAIKAAQ